MSMPPYGTAMHEAIASGELNTMKATARRAEEHLAEFGDVAAALEVLKAAIAKLERRGTK